MVRLSERAPSRLPAFLLEVFRHPHLWILRYALVTLPSLVLSVGLLAPLRRWFQHPLFVAALDARSLDWLLDVLDAGGEELAAWEAVTALGVLFLFLLPIVWLLVRGLWIFFEGGVLAAYARLLRPVAPRLAVREFLKACWRWFGTFLALGLVWGGLTATLAAGVGLLSMLLRRLWAPLGAAALLVGGAGVVLIWMWISVARSTAVLREDGNIFHALGGAARVVTRRPARSLGLFVVALVGQLLLTRVVRAGVAILPYDWWLAALLLQQAGTSAGIGLTLLRRAGELGLAAQVFPEILAAAHTDR